MPQRGGRHRKGARANDQNWCLWRSQPSQGMPPCSPPSLDRAVDRADLYLGAPRHRWAWAAVAAWAPSLHLGLGSARVAGDVGSLLLTSRALPFAPFSPGADARGRAFAKRRLAG